MDTVDLTGGRSRYSIDSRTPRQPGSLSDQNFCKVLAAALGGSSQFIEEFLGWDHRVVLKP